MPNEKIEVAIYDNDLKIRTMKKYEVSDDGTQIRIISGGEGHFMPKFDQSSFLEFGGRKKFLLFGEREWKRIYFVKKKGAKCVNFATGEVTGPSPEESKKAIGATLLHQIGQEKQDTPWQMWALLAINIFILAIVAGVVNI